MKAHRNSPNAEWWRFYFTESCRCAGCSGKETDLFTVFEARNGQRFAIHFEIKQPADRFKQDGIQSKGYALRAECWAKNPPPKVLPHTDASTGLFFSESKRKEYAAHLDCFDAKITFEEIAKEFPEVAEWNDQDKGGLAQA